MVEKVQPSSCHNPRPFNYEAIKSVRSQCAQDVVQEGWAKPGFLGTLVSHWANPGAAALKISCYVN